MEYAAEVETIKEVKSLLRELAFNRRGVVICQKAVGKKLLALKEGKPKNIIKDTEKANPILKVSL